MRSVGRGGYANGVSAAQHDHDRAEAELDRPDPAAVPPATTRQEILGASGALLLAGAWLIVSPYALGYERGDAAWNPILVGALVLLLGLARLTLATWLSSISWLTAALGGWLVASALWLAESVAARWNEAVGGAVVVVLALLSGGATDAARRRAARRG